MIHVANIRVACLFFALFVVGCHAKHSQNVRQQSPLTPVAQEVERRGYHAKESLIVAPSAWEISTFRMRSKQVFSFRADQPDAGTRNYFCRFSLFEETYDSPDDARFRIANVHLPNPEGPVGERDYLSLMRTGFHVGSVAYVLQTDAITFWDEVQRFAKELATATPGAELTRATINAPPNKSLDASGGSVFRIIIGPAMVE